MTFSKSAVHFGRLAAVLVGGILVFGLTGCTKDDKSPTGPTEGGDTTASFTAVPRAYIRKQVTGPGKISFTVKGIDHDEPDSRAIVYFYDAKGYTGGVGDYGFEGELRNLKVKWFDTNGNNISEAYHFVHFTPPQSYNIVLEWGADFIKVMVDGVVVSHKFGSVAGTFTLGIGWPPVYIRDRGGFNGAVYTNVVWPEGATPVQ
jgi:hypothetical protein